MRRLVPLAAIALLAALALPTGAAAAPWGQRTLLDSGGVDQAQIEVSPNGHAVATWADAAGNVRVALRAPGHPWSLPATLATDTFPRVVSGVTDGGKAVVVWSTAGPTLKFAIVDPNLTFTSGTVGFSAEFPSLSVTGAGLAALTFIDAADSSVRYGTMDLGSASVFTVGGGGLNATIPVLTNGAPGPKIVTDETGDIAVFFLASLTTPTRFPLEAVFVPHNDTPGSPHEVSDDAVQIQNFNAVLDADGIAAAVWTQGMNGDVYGNDAAVGGAWGGATPIAIDPGGFVQLSLSAGPAGTADGVFLVPGVAPRSSVEAFHFTGSAWLAPQTLSTNSGFVSTAQVLELPTGATVLWNEFLSGLDYDAAGSTRPAALSTWPVPAAVIPSLGIDATIGPVAPDAAGNAQALTFAHSFSTGLAAVTFDLTPPTLTASGPSTLTAKVSGSFHASAGDAFAGLAGPVAWHFSDGATASGAAVSHAFAAAGSYTATATATDGAGNATVKTLAVRVLTPPDTIKPVLKLGPSKAKVKKGKVKVTVSCTDEVKCTGTITLKVGSKRVARKAFTAGGKKKTTVTLKLKLAKSAKKTLAKKHKLSAKLSATATDAAGNKGTKSAKLSLRR